MTPEKLPPLSLYVHLPWCVRKCPYCDFNSYEAQGPLAERAYVAALLRDLDAELRLVQGRAVSSLFMGGGTPSLFSGAAIETLLDGIRARVPLVADVEITLEANPGAVEAARFSAYRAAGVNRLSIGLQSLRDKQLVALGRVHDATDALRAVETARRAGFLNVNVDLMYGLPDDDVEGSLGDLAAAIELQPTHVSWYQLTLEPGTAFHRRPPPALPAEEIVLDIEAAGRELLAGCGFERYEISAYARPGYRCVHNLSYWRFADYLGIGAGAHGKLTGRDGTIVRHTKTRNPRTYVELAGTAGAVSVTPVESSAARTLEFMMNALRLADGIELAVFEQRTGQPRAAIADAVQTAARRGWLTADAASVKPTPTGLQMLNSMLTLF